MIMRRSMTAGIAVTIVIVAALPGLGPAGECHAQADDRLPLAASDSHLWFVAAGSTNELRLMHHALSMDGPYYTPGPVLPGVPQAMAAWGEQVWLVAPAEKDRPRTRSVLSARVQQNPALGGYYFVPHGRLALEPALPGEGVLAQFAAGPDGPLALIMPQPDIPTSGRAASETDAHVETILAPRLLQLTSGRWEPIDLPAENGVATPVFLALSGADARVINLLAVDDADPTRARLLVRDASANWHARTLALDLHSIAGLIRYHSQVVALVEQPDSDIQMLLVRPDGVTDLGQVEHPGGRWGIDGLGNSVVLVEADSRGEFGWQRFDPITSKTTSRQVMSHQPLGTSRLVHIPLLVATAVTVLMLVFLFRPASPPGAIVLPADTVAASPIARLVALAIDLVPGVLISVITMRVSLLELLRLPVWTARLEDGAPALIMIAVTTLHCTISELIWSRTLGKALTGLEVVSTGGGSPSVVAILLRNLGKLVVLLVPPLAVVALLNRHIQGLGDMLGRTAVVMPREQADRLPENRDSRD